MISQAKVAVIKRSAIIVGKRFREDYGDIDTLAASFKKEGIIQPLAVKDNEDGTYELAAGGRRMKAAEQAGIDDIPVRLYSKELTELELRSIELMENLARKDLSWHEAAKLNKEIHEIQQKIYGKKVSTSPDASGVSMRDTANLLGKSIGGLSDDIKICNAIQMFPEIGKAKTKHDAMKMIKKLEETVVMSEISKRLQDKINNTPIDILRNSLMNNYILQDFFEGIKKVPDRSIDIVELDPPYGINLHDLKKQGDTKDYNEVPAEIYADFLQRVFQQCYRVMSENSWLICWFAQEPWFETIYASAKSVGFTGSRIAAIWSKGTGQTMNPATGLANTYEPFFYFRKGSPSIIQQGRSNIFEYKPVASSRKIHPTERPVELIQEVLRTFAWEGCRGLVPFLGSGNTLLAMANAGISGFGFDLTEKYKDGYVIRVNEGRPGSYRSYREEV